jgi:XTP/dITP diphosphohydrolase
VSSRRVVLATRNASKVDELRRILGAERIDADLLSLDDFPDVPDVAETGTTFAENATLKARAVAAATGLVSVADDSGLAIDVLGGMPGVFSARWSGRHGDDVANLELVLAQLRDVPDAYRRAAFVCSAVLAVPGGDGPARAAPGGAARTTGPAGVIVAEGRWEGAIIREPRGSNGFGYDPIFVPVGESRTSAELSAAQKDANSHRGRAFRALAPSIAKAVSG